MANRVSQNPNDDARRIAAEAANKAELQRVNKVEAVDPDQRAKQNKFRNLMQGTEDEQSDAQAAQATPSPSPVQSTFYQSTKHTGIDPELALPSPAYSPSPRADQAADSFGLVPVDPISDVGLPESPGYYQNSDLPWEPINPPNFEEEPSPSVQPTNQAPKEKKTDRLQPLGKQQPKEKIEQTKDLKGPASPQQKEKQIEPSPFGPPGKTLAPKHFEGHPLSKKAGEKAPAQKKAEESTQPTTRFWNEEKIQSPPPATRTTKKEPERTITGTEKAHETITRPQEQVRPFEPVAEKMQRDTGHQEAKSEEKGHGTKKGPSEITPPSLSTLPPQIQPAAEAAAIAAAPYIRPEIQAHYYQMVGTIMMMAKTPGVSKTEFLLNNPAFANSKFYGASIEVTRFSTAPDAFNIRLTGTTEAVNAFNQSIPSLMSAFQNGNFNFRINRIEAEHSTERPVFHRKGQDSDSSKREGKEK